MTLSWLEMTECESVFDTSALVKIFHNEEGSERTRELILNAQNNLYILDIAQIEYFSAIFRRYRNHELSKKSLNIAISGFEKEISHYCIEPITPLVIKEAQNLIFSYGDKFGLRTLDSLHLAAFSLISSEDWIFVCCDSILSCVTEECQFTVFNPIRQENEGFNY